MTNAQPTPNPSVLVWWIIWFAQLSVLLVMQQILQPEAQTTQAGSLGYVALVPLAISLALRFFLLPRLPTRARAFPIFVSGLACAEAGGLLGLFLGGSHWSRWVALSVGTLLVYIPLFATKYDQDRSSPFRNS